MTELGSSPSLFESAWDKTLKEPFTTEEAIHLWQKGHEMARAFPDGDRLMLMIELLAKECGKGDRCGVCGCYQSEECWTGC